MKGGVGCRPWKKNTQEDLVRSAFLSFELAPLPPPPQISNSTFYVDHFVLTLASKACVFCAVAQSTPLRTLGFSSI